MAILTIYQDSRRRGTCRSCGAAVEWAELTRSGKHHPFDGAIVVTRTQGSVLAGDRIVEHVDTAISPSHFATCPQAKDWRRRA